MLGPSPSRPMIVRSPFPLPIPILRPRRASEILPSGPDARPELLDRRGPGSLMLPPQAIPDTRRNHHTPGRRHVDERREIEHGELLLSPFPDQSFQGLDVVWRHARELFVDALDRLGF